MLDRIIASALRLLWAAGLAFALGGPAAASHLVTGNGLGFAVVAPESGIATKFYPHPYSYVRPDPANPLSEGIETANFIKALWLGRARPAGHRGLCRGFACHPDAPRRRQRQFLHAVRLERPALIIAADARGASWRVRMEPAPALAKGVSAAGAAVAVRRDRRAAAADPARQQSRKAPADQPLAASPAWALIALESDKRSRARRSANSTRWRAGLSARALVSREIAEFERWRAKPAVRFKDAKERHLWRQSETMLRIAQSREPNRPDRHGNGLIVAALPDVYFDALGPRHGLGDGGARPHGPPGRGARRAPRLFQCAADRQNARRGERRRLPDLGGPLFRRRRRGALLHPGGQHQHRVRRLGRGAVGARRISAQVRRPRAAPGRHPSRAAVRERARFHRRSR